MSADDEHTSNTAQMKTVRFNATPEVSTSTSVSSSDSWYTRDQLKQFHAVAKVTTRHFRALLTRCPEDDPEREEHDIPRGLERKVSFERQKEKVKAIKSVVECQRRLLSRDRGTKRSNDDITSMPRRLSMEDTQKIAAVSSKLTANAAEVAQHEGFGDYLCAHPKDATDHMTQQNSLLLQQRKILRHLEQEDEISGAAFVPLSSALEMDCDAMGSDDWHHGKRTKIVDCPSNHGTHATPIHFHPSVAGASCLFSRGLASQNSCVPQLSEGHQMKLPAYFHPPYHDAGDFSSAKDESSVSWPSNREEFFHAKTMGAATGETAYMTQESSLLLRQQQLLQSLEAEDRATLTSSNVPAEGRSSGDNGDSAPCEEMWMN